MRALQLPGLDSVRKLALLSQDLGLLDQLRLKLTRQPDKAAAMLATALEELLKSLLLLESELVSFLSLSFGDLPNVTDQRRVLLTHESQALHARMNEARGHCARIGNIYSMYLNPWFQRVAGLRKTERDSLAHLFSALSMSDSLMVDTLDEVARWLALEARQVSELVEHRKLAEANHAILRARVRIAPVRRVLARTMARLYKLEAAFINASDVT